jgi:hypothetical protein
MLVGVYHGGYMVLGRLDLLIIVLIPILPEAGAIYL